MKVAFHVGIYGTDMERTVRTLMQNRDWMLTHRIEPIPPARHRALFDEALASLSGRPAPAQTEAVLREAIIETDDPVRIICAQPSLAGPPSLCVGPEGLCHRLAEHLVAAAGLFPSGQTEFFLALKNPATLVPALIGLTDAPQARATIANTEPAKLRWAPTIRRAVSALEGRRLIIWCHEDTPLIWPEVLRRMATMPQDIALKGGLSLIAELLTPEGLDELRRDLAAEAHLSIARRREIFTRILSTHARPEAVETEINLPGWDQATVDQITRDYASDVAEIAALPGVEFMTP